MKSAEMKLNQDLRINTARVGDKSKNTTSDSKAAIRNLPRRVLYIAALLLLPGALIVLPLLWWLEHRSHHHGGTTLP
jgi:hypothetical protein